MSETFRPKNELRPAVATPPNPGSCRDWKNAFNRFWEARGIIQPNWNERRPMFKAGPRLNA